MKNRDEGEIKRALKYSYRLLALRDRGQTELIERLTKRGFHRDVVEDTVRQLKDMGYINDSRLAETLIRTALEQKHYGKYAITTYLRSKGIDDSIVENLDLCNEDYISSARRFVKKKLKTMKAIDADERVKRLSTMLQRRGHDFDTIREVLKEGGSEDV
jgi:regulatory protein